MIKPRPAQHRSPLIEPLESRQLYATTPAPLPDLKASLTYSVPPFVRPGSVISPTLVLTNVGGDMTKAVKMPISYWLSETPKLARDAEPFQVIASESVNLLKGKTGSFRQSIRIPTDATARQYYIFVGINTNGRRLKEAHLGNNTTRTQVLTSPVGTYTGHFAGNDGQFGPVSLKLDPIDTGKGLLADLTVRSNLGTLRFEGIRAYLKPKGNFTLADKGAQDHPTLGRINYRVLMEGKLEGTTLTVNLRLIWHAPKGSRNTFDSSLQLKRT